MTFDELLKELDKDPELHEVKTREDGVVYIPIEIIEDKLNRLFPGWSTKEFKQLVGNNHVVGSLELIVPFPAFVGLVTRIGAGAVQIESLEKEPGHLKADCIKNAAKSLGNTFGRSLLRGQEEVIDSFEIKPETIEERIKGCKSQEELSDYYREVPTVQRNRSAITLLFKRREVELKVKTDEPVVFKAENKKRKGAK